MNLNIDISKYIVPTLGTACVCAAMLVVSGMRTPVSIDPVDAADIAEARMPKNLVLDSYIPSMEEVVATHLFVPEREATGENAFPDLRVKGVYVGETQRNAVFSLKSKPEANLRVWQGDEDAAMAQVEDERDPRRPIVDFLSEWEIKSVDFAGVTVQHIITGEVETYEVDYKPLKHVKASAGAGYGQGLVVDSSAGAKPAAAKPASAGQQAAQARPPTGSPQAIAGRVGQYMQNLSPQQRQQFMQQLQKQRVNAAKNSSGGAAQQNGGGSSNKRSDSKKSSSKKKR